MFLGFPVTASVTVSINSVAATASFSVGSREGVAWIPSQVAPLESVGQDVAAAAAAPASVAQFTAQMGDPIGDEGVIFAAAAPIPQPEAIAPQQPAAGEGPVEAGGDALNSPATSAVVPAPGAEEEVAAPVAAAVPVPAPGEDLVASVEEALASSIVTTVPAQEVAQAAERQFQEQETLNQVFVGPMRAYDVPNDIRVREPLSQQESLEAAVGSRPIFVYERYREQRPKRGTRGRGRLFLGRREVDWSDMHTDCLSAFRDPLARPSQAAWRSQLQRHLINKYARDPLEIFFSDGERVVLRPQDASNWKVVISLSLTSMHSSLARQALMDEVGDRQTNWREMWEQYHCETANESHMGLKWRVWLWWRSTLLKVGVPAPLPPRQ